ncbi:MAG: Tex family protein [Rhodoferax sp.]|uniref:Tex family protein n=1 Tax=Rhodoferax sp. TaxID=50421 RepID=UPI003C73077F
MQKIIAQIAQEIRVQAHQVVAAVALLDGGATVPFIARYRKEVTGGLDDIQLRELEARLGYLRELRDRLQTVIKAIDEQGKLTPALLAALHAASTKQELEDLYLPFKLKRRTKGQLAREAGLEPLADALFANPGLVPADEALAYVIPMRPVVEGEDKQPDFSTVAAVLDGVRDLLSERWAETPALVQDLREWLWLEGLLQSRLMADKDENQADVAKFRDYFDYDEPISRVPSHRALAVFRGRSLDILEAKLVVPEPLPVIAGLTRNPVQSGAWMPDQVRHDKRSPAVSLAEGRIALKLGWSHQGRPADDLIRKCVAWTWRVKLSLSTERDLFARLREEAERVAIKVFADNLRDLLLAAPAGPRVVLGLDPGIRTGVKVAVVDATGKLVDTTTVYPHEPRKDWDGSLHTLAKLCDKHGVNLIAIGNGTASRETDKLAADLIKLMAKSSERAMEKVVVSEAGASVYSASEFASQEMPDVDVSLRGAASIARRLQDPLAELVKIDPKSIGVGQYQHDVNQSDLAKTLDAVVEDCVNAVGVDLNMASVPLLSRVSGLSASVAKAVVRWREANGAFASRQDLLKVTGLGAKTFEQSAGFLRIRGGVNPLDMTGVHPETYPVVEQIIAKTGKPVTELMGRADMLKTLRPELFANAQFGVITVKDILGELEKPGRDPRPDFKVARFNDGVEDIKDLKEGMVLEGTVSNVAAFGAFIDLGVHQDGLVHVSQLSHKFVTDAREVVKTGAIVKVQVVEVDVARKRIALTMKLGAAPARSGSAGDNRFQGANAQQRGRTGGQGFGNGTGPGAHAPQSTAMSSAFAKLKNLGH